MPARLLRVSVCCLLLGLPLACGEDNAQSAGGNVGGHTSGVPDGFGFGSSGGTSSGGTSSGGDEDAGSTSSSSGGAEDSAEPAEKACAEPGAWGCPCADGNDCDSSLCIESAGGQVCTKTCIDSCPMDWVCKQKDASDTTFICLPRFVALCRPCSEHKDCGGGAAGVGEAKCLPFEKADNYFEGRFCGAPCAKDADCPDGYGCKSLKLGEKEAETKQCVPISGECKCSEQAKSLKLSTECWRTNEHGTCKGTRTCTDAGLTLCNVAQPAAEVCDGEDNDCDGQTDEEGAIGCKTYYPDADGDGAGIGDGKCLCSSPGGGYALTGGDCNDQAKSIKPSAKEICNGTDDNCNDKVDEAGATGCKDFYKDADNDLFGDPNDAACLCPTSPTKGYVAQAGDCDDSDDKVKPGATEICNAKDDNCNEKVDEENAQGCTPFFIDGDKDGYGPTDKSKCLCGKDPIYTANKAGDCDDNDPKVFPTNTETCNGKDDDCNGKTDDGAAPQSCPALQSGKPACVNGKCAVSNCPPGYFDVDGNYQNGCECKADSNFGKVGTSCKGADDVGSMGDGGSKVVVSGNVMPGEAGDWFKFKAVDGPDVGGCDSFHVRARFLKNPDNNFVLDLYRGSCAGASQVCKEQVDSEWTVSYYGKPYGPQAKAGQSAGAKVKSPQPLPAGECKCSTKTGGTGPGQPGMNVCQDNGAMFYVRVGLKPGAKPTCTNYKLELSNGLYKPKKTQ